MRGVARQIRSLVAAKFGIDETMLRQHVDLSDDLGADSLDLVELLIAIEGLFEIRIPDEDFAELQTLDEVTGYVAARL
jgi:acyl carrier protein